MQIENWVEKYRPQTLSDVVGNSRAVQELREWAQSWVNNSQKTPENKATILHGRAGTGKTSSAYALANEMGWETLELNASDQRTKLKIEEATKRSSIMGTIDGSIRLIIVDEADNFHGREDRGGEKAVIELIKKTRQPIALTANEFYELSHTLRTSCKVIKFNSILSNTMIEILENITRAENITYDIGVIEKIADHSDGDLRGAINDLQAASQGRSHIKLEDVITGERDIDDNVFNVMKNIFRAENIKQAYEATFDLDQDPEHFIQWMTENVPYEYTRPIEVDDAFERLSKAGVFLGRTRRRQNYGMWRYASALMTAGVFAAKTGRRRKDDVKYYKPQVGNMLWKTKGMRSVRDSLAKKIGDRCHTSIGFARSDLFQFFRTMTKNRSYAEYVAASLELSLEEIAFILDKNMDKEHDAKEVQEIYKKAQSVLKEDKELVLESSSALDEKALKEESTGKWGKAQQDIDSAWGL